jgi:DNA phosphorothioation-associated putative methyltransferase
MIRRDLTAMARNELSKPMQIAIEHEVVQPLTTTFDYGCGRGHDVDALHNLNWKIRGWDPLHRNATKKIKSDVVTLIYVINVIERPAERQEVLKAAWNLTKKCLVIAVRLEHERDEAHIRPHADGWMTSKSTFQKFFNQDEITNWIESVLGVDVITAAPGLLYVFKDKKDLEEFRARRYRIRIPSKSIRISDNRFKEHQEVLRTVIDFVAMHGRIPKDSELEETEIIKNEFGTIKQAFRVIQTVTDRDEWVHIAEKCRIELLVHLALRTFDGQYKMSELPLSTQHDIRAFFGSLKIATNDASRLLFSVGNLESIQLACRSSTVGKLTPSALYIHRDALHLLPAALRVYEACARRIVGEIPEANLIKLHRDSKMVSYLSYPDFWDNPHPPLNSSFTVNLVEQSFSFHGFAKRANRPILHRKELFIPKTDVRYAKFANLSVEEQRAGLYDEPNLIGTEEGWKAQLLAKNIKIDTNHEVGSTN